MNFKFFESITKWVRFSQKVYLQPIHPEKHKKFMAKKWPPYSSHEHFAFSGHHKYIEQFNTICSSESAISLMFATERSPQLPYYWNRNRNHLSILHDVHNDQFQIEMLINPDGCKIILPIYYKLIDASMKIFNNGSNYSSSIYLSFH